MDQSMGDISSHYIQDGEQINLSEICRRLIERQANVIPKSSTLGSTPVEPLIES